MNGRRAIVGLCMLCALFVSAFAAQGASASNGTTGFTCVKKAKPEGAGFSKEHCRPEDAVTTGAAYEHVVIPENTTTELSGTNAKTCENTTTACVTRLKSVRAGVELEISATGVSGTGTMVNKKVAGEKGEHYAEGTGMITYTGAQVTKPAGKGCTVYKNSETIEANKEIITTKELKATTKEQGMFLKFEPDEGTTFATFNVAGCSVAGLNGEYVVTGSVKGVPNGATTVFTHAETTTQGTLFLGGQKAGIDGSITLSTRANSTQAFTPLSSTTVET